MNVSFVVLLSIFLISFCSCEGTATNENDISTTDENELILPSNPYSFILYQRSSIEIPSQTGEIFSVSIDDITHGQTELELKLNNNLIELKSIQENDIVSFKIGEHTYELKCDEQINFLIGEDYASFSLYEGSAELLGEHSNSDIEAIEQLIIQVESSDVVFLRNGTSHIPKEAADHLRMKWKQAGVDNLTLEEFIDKVASKSSFTGEEYKVKLPNGTIVTAKEWYKDLLEKELE